MESTAHAVPAPLPGSLSLRRVERLDAAPEEWDELAEGAGHPFATLEWNRTWWRHFGGDSELFTFACYGPGDEILAILPLYIAQQRPVRVARFLGYGPVQTPLCRPEHRSLAAAAMRRLVGRGKGRCRLILAERIPGEQAWDELLGGAEVSTDSDPVLRIDGRSWDELLTTTSSKFRKQVRYQERRLERDHGMTFRLADDPDRLEDDMKTLFTLHDKRWGELSTGIFVGARAQQHLEFAAQALDRGWLRLWIEEVDGRPAAAYHGLRYAGSEWFFQSGRDPAFDRLSVGSVLLAKVIRDACDDGMVDFRFLLGDEPYKFKFANDDYRPQTRLIGSAPAEYAGKQALGAVRAMPDSMRDRVLSLRRLRTLGRR